MIITSKYFLFLLFLIAAVSGYTQPYTINVSVKNQPKQRIVLGIMKGDTFLPVDSAYAVDNKVSFALPSHSRPGVYRLNFGKTTYARVMDEPPQLLDFIFNKENIAFETDFNTPEKSLKIIESEENRIWFSFINKEKVLEEEISKTEKKLNSYRKNGDETLAIKAANEYNLLQLDRDLLISQIVKANSGLFVTQMVKTYKTIILDGYLTEQERKKSFQKRYFDFLDFNNVALIYSPCYTDNVFKYLLTFNDFDFTPEEREESYKQAVKTILLNTGENKEVQKFIIEYLIHGFEVLKMDNLVQYIAEFDTEE